MATGLALVLNAVLLAQGQPIREGMSLQAVKKAFGEPQVITEGQKKTSLWIVDSTAFLVSLGPDQRVTHVEGTMLYGRNFLPPPKEAPFQSVFNFKDLFRGLSNADIVASLPQTQADLLRAWERKGGTTVGHPPQEATSATLRAYHELLRRGIVHGFDTQGESAARLRAVEESLRLRAAAQRGTP